MSQSQLLSVSYVGETQTAHTTSPRLRFSSSSNSPSGVHKRMPDGSMPGLLTSKSLNLAAASGVISPCSKGKGMGMGGLGKEQQIRCHQSV